MNRDIGQYKIFNQIGKGSFGTVYKGLDKLTGEQVALKFIQKKQKRPRDIKNLREQNDLLKKISHPNVICLKDVIETPKQIIIVTDYAGQDLSGVISEVKKFSLDKVKDYSMQILNAMLYLNQNRIIHRDLKPQNILINGNHIKICDFGFAKKLSASTNFLQSMKGTPLYLAPEIIREVKYTQKVDIWSFGCIIYQLFTGKTPYYANTYQKLVPLILYQPINYPKQMPAELKDLISSMLQKNPSVRPDWKQLKNHPFFKQTQVLKQKIDNNLLKEVVSMQISQKNYFPQKLHQMIELNKQNNKIIQKEQQIIESKVILKIQNQTQLRNYQSEFKRIYAELLVNIIDGKELRKDIIFLHKIKTVFHQRSQKNPLITNEVIEASCNIINYLIKLRKGNSNNQNLPDNNNNDDDDITKNTALIFGLLCLAKVQKNYDMLEKQLQTIGRLVKGTFNGVAINSQIDEEITQFVTEILLENTQNLPIQCIKTGLITIGIMVNQAMLTLNNSFAYFERVAEDNLLTKIAKIYRKEEKYATVLQLLKAFIHPGKKIANMTGNPHHLIHPKMERIFQSLKEEVAEALLKTDFFSQISPLDVYTQKNHIISDYCCVLLECLRNSSECRKQYLKYSHWNRFLGCKRLKSFIFAYNSIFIEQDDKSVLSTQEMVKSTQQSHQNKLNNISILQMSYLKLKKKPDCISGLKFKKSLLEKVSELIFIDEALKSNFCQQVYGFLETTSKRFDEALIELFFNMVGGIKPMQNCDEYKQLVQTVVIIFKKICHTSNSFKPTSRSLFRLMSLLTENEILKNAKCQKSVQAFLYDCISGFIRREDFEYLESQFQENKIQKFIAKFIQSFNLLMEIQEIQNKTSSLSSNAVNFTKQIQTSSFYRFMFIEKLAQECFFEHLKCSLKIIAKTVQTPDFMNFMGVKVIPMCKNYINSKMQPLMTEIFAFLSTIAREHSQFNNQIMDTGIIKKFREWLTSEAYSQHVKQKVLYLIGNLAKRSDFFFGEFQAYSTIDAITVCLKSFYTNPKILKNAIYSIGNISFYSQKFYKQIQPMIPYFAKAFDTNDANVKNNLISTTSNLMRYSNIFLSHLIKTGLIANILKMACDSPQIDQNLGGLIMSLVKKILPYDEFYQAFGCKELKVIYQRRQMFGGDANETIRKIKEFLISHGQFI